MEFIRFSREKLNETREFIHKSVERISFDLTPKDAVVRFRQIGTETTWEAHEGDYIVRTDNAIPNMLPVTNYLEVRKDCPATVN